MQHITIEELIDRYAVLLLDSSGVLIHGAPLPGAVEFISELNRSRKPYLVLTNDASRLPERWASLYRNMGLEIPSERIITAGSLLAEHFAANDLKGSHCVVIGEDYPRHVEGAGGIIVSADAPFDVLVITNPTDDGFLDTANAVLSALFQRLDRQEAVHLVCLNPDLIYPHGDQEWGFGPGSVALFFEAALELRYPDRDDLLFVRLGKPHDPIFVEALRRSGTRDMVMIGDQMKTDILGANSFGLDSVLMTTGVTTVVPGATPSELRPTYLIDTLMPNSYG